MEFLEITILSSVKETLHKDHPLPFLQTFFSLISGIASGYAINGSLKRRSTKIETTQRKRFENAKKRNILLKLFIINLDSQSLSV